MKKIITFLAVVLCTTGAFSQYYYNAFTSAGMNPGGLNPDQEFPSGGGLTTGWTPVVGPNIATPTWSPNQTIPFAFSFDASPVTEYKASSNGVLTFTTSATAVPSNTKEALPSANIPDKSVCVWGLQTVGANDMALSKTFGTAPNRQHWIFYTSCALGGTGWSYWSIVLEETTNNIYIVDQRHSGTTGGVSMGIQIDATTATSVGADVMPLAGTDASDADNAYYEFIQGVQPANDILISSVNLANVESNANPIAITGNARNNGSAAITNFDLSWTADGGVTNNSVNIVANIAPGAAYAYTHPTNWTPVAGVSYTVDVTGSNPNGVIDGNPGNNTASATTFVNSGIATDKSVLLEEFTTAPCQFCPDGAVVVEQILDANPDVIAVGEHACFGTDAMTIPAAQAYCAAFSSGAPTATVDRTLFPNETRVGHSRGQWTGNVLSRQNLRSAVEVNISGTYDSTSRAVSVDFLANFVDVVPSGDIRVTVFVVEDNVTGTGTGYDQVNAYNTQTGHPYFGAGSRIAGFNHRHVLRDVVTATWGDNSVIPSTPVVATQYTKNYSFTLSNLWDDNEVKLVAFVHYYDAAGREGNEIMNAKEVPLDDVFTAIVETSSSVQGLKIYPNPTADVTNIKFNLSNSQSVSLVVRDIAGKEVLSQAFGIMTAGVQNIAINASNLSNGIYFTTIQIGEELVTRKITVNK